MSKIMAAFSRVTKRQWILIGYLAFHLTWFFIMEQLIVSEYIVIYSPLDDMIPFCEWLIFPYLFWFPYMFFMGLYLLIKDAKMFERYMLSLDLGFMLSMIIISIWPNGQDLRPVFDAKENIASYIVAFIHSFDTNTNVFPSMHVVGTVGVVAAAIASKDMRKNRALQVFMCLFALFRVAGTVMLKQHSILDVFSGVILESFVLVLVYTGLASRGLDAILGKSPTSL
jgi:hypothetical protein